MSRLVGCASHVALAAPFVPVGVTNPGTKGSLLSRLPPGCQTRDKRTPSFVPAWRSRLGNRDNKGFPTRPMVFSTMAFSSAARFQSICVLGLPLLCRWGGAGRSQRSRRRGFLELSVCKGPGDLVVIVLFLGPFV